MKTYMVSVSESIATNLHCFFLKQFTSGFVEEPLSLNVAIGEEAVFRCEHRSADAIVWRINETSLIDFPGLHDDFIDENVGSFNTLTVTALPKYNTTVVQCVAAFLSDSSQQELTSTAILQIQG